MLASLQTPIGVTMSAIITSTSQTVETRIVDNAGNTVSTTYHDNLNEAIDVAERFNVGHIELEEMDI